MIFVAVTYSVAKNVFDRLPAEKARNWKDKLKRKWGKNRVRIENDINIDRFMDDEPYDPQLFDIEDQYDRNGNYFKCKECSKYTLHVKNDKICENLSCSTNETVPSHYHKVWPSIYSKSVKSVKVPNELDTYEELKQND